MQPVRDTTIYLAPYHSSFEGYGKGACSAEFLPLSMALECGEWPYDTGDDPSFFSQRYFRGQLTWGICRQHIRNRIQTGDIVVFFSFRSRGKGQPVEYRICACQGLISLDSDSESGLCDERMQFGKYHRRQVER